MLMACGMACSCDAFGKGAQASALIARSCCSRRSTGLPGLAVVFVRRGIQPQGTTDQRFRCKDDLDRDQTSIWTVKAAKILIAVAVDAVGFEERWKAL